MAKPVVPETESLRVMPPTRSNVVTNAARAATVAAIANNRTTVRLGFRSVLMSNSTQTPWRLTSVRKLRTTTYRCRLSLRELGRARSGYQRDFGDPDA